jgi:hypothetical protein
MHLGRQWKRMAFNKLENPEEMLDSTIFGLRRGERFRRGSKPGFGFVDPVLEQAIAAMVCA